MSLQNEQRAKVREFIELYENLNGLLEYLKSAIKGGVMLSKLLFDKLKRGHSRERISK